MLFIMSPKRCYKHGIVRCGLLLLLLSVPEYTVTQPLEQNTQFFPHIFSVESAVEMGFVMTG